MRQRILTAVIGVPLLIGTVYFDPLYARLAFALIAFLALQELQAALININLKVQPVLLIIYLGICFLDLDPLMTRLPLYFSLYLLAILSYFAYKYPKYSLEQLSVNLLVAVYPAWPLLYALKLRLLPDDGSAALLLVFLLTWAYDTFAYIGGMLMGKHRPFGALSPSKSIEGVVWGTLGTVITAFSFNYFCPTFQPYLVLGLGLGAALFAQVGDLAESALKRYCGIKDSGKLLPGHGGFLDRFDAFSFVAVLVYLVYSLRGI